MPIRLSTHSSARLIRLLLVAAMLMGTAPMSVVYAGSDAPAARSASPAARPADGRPTSNVAQGSATISATKRDALQIDADSSSNVTAGDTLRYTVVIRNTGGADATGVTFNDDLDASTTLSGTLKTTPLARNDSYSAAGNIQISQNAASGVLNNDVDPDGSGAVTVVGSDTASANGGEVSVNADGSFTYNPPAGFEGVDTFTYTIQDVDGNQDVGTVSVTVSGMIWFINNDAGACSTNCNGRLTNPFTSLSAFASVNNGAGNNPAAGDSIFLYESATNYTGPVTLLNNQRLIGQDATSSLSTLSGVTPPAGSLALPAMNSGNGTIVNITSAGNGIVLASNNRLHGFTAGNASGIAISGSSFGTLTVADVRINTTGAGLSLTTGTTAAVFLSTTSSGGTNNVSLTGVNGSIDLGSGALSGASSHGFAVDGGTATISFSGTINNTAARSVSVINKTGGTVTFSGAVSGTANGVFLNNNTGATFNFTGGGMNLSTGANAGFTATGGGTLNVTGSNNTIASTTGTALNVTSTTIGASGLTFRSISANGGAVGIILDTTGATAGLSVTGDGSTLGSGGTLQNLSQDGVRMRNTRNSTLKFMNITNVASAAGATCTTLNASDCNSGVDMVGATNIALDRVIIDGSGQQGLNGHNLSGFQFTNGQVRNAGNGNDEFGMLFSQLSGSVLIQDSIITRTLEGGIRLYNNTGTLNMTVQRATIGANDALSGFGEDGFQLQIEGSASATILVDDSDLNLIQRDGVDALIQGTGGAVLNLTVQNSRFMNNFGFGGVTAFTGNTATARFTLSGNLFRNTVSTAINLVSGNTSTFDAQVLNNTIQHPAPPATQIGFGIRLSQEEDSNMTALVQGNSVSGTGFDGMRLFSRLGDTFGSPGSTGTLHVTVQDNTVAAPLNATFGMDIRVQSTDNLICLDIRDLGAPGNNVVNGNVSAGLRARTDFSGAMQVEGLALGAQTAATMATFLNANNTSTPAATATTATSFTGVAVGTCRDAVSTPLPSVSASPIQVVQQLDQEAGAMSGRIKSLLIRPFTDRADRGTGLDRVDLPLDAPITPLNIGVLPAGKAITLTFDATIDPGFLGTQVSNQGQVSGSNFTTVLTDDPDTGAPNDPTVTPVVGPMADISVTKSDNPDPVKQGSPLTYTLTIANNGPDTAQTVLVTDTLPTSASFNFATITQGSCGIAFPTLACQIGSMNNGDVVTLTIRVTPNTPGTITNSAVVTTATTDPNTGNNADSEDTTVNALQADISVTKSDNPDPVKQGSPLTYTVTIANNGPDTAQTVLITDTLPASASFNFATITQGSCGIAFPTLACQIGSMNSGDTVTLIIRVTPNTPGTITNGAVVTTATSDPDTSNNADSEDTTVNPLEADISVTKSDDPDPVVIGTPLTYTVTIHNYGPDTAQTVLVTDTLPASASFNFATITQGSCGIAFPTLACQIGSMNSGDTVTLIIRVTPNTSGTITNNAVVTTATNDPDTGNNADSEDTTVLNTGSITIVKQANSAGSFDFTGDLGNFSLNDGGSTTFNDVVAGTYSVTESDPAPTFNLTSLVCDDGNSTVDIDARTAAIHLEPGEDVTCTFTNTLAEPAIALDKQEPAVADGEGPVTYTYLVTNPGNVPLTNVSVSDDKCSPVAYQSGDDGNGKLDPSETWTFTCSYTPDFTPLDTLTNQATASGKYYEQTLTADDSSTLYPFTLRKQVFLYWDTSNTVAYTPGDNTSFSVEVSRDNVLLTTVTISQNSPKRLWLSYGTFKFKEVNLPSGYVTGYYNLTYTTGQGYPDWTYPNVATYDLTIDKTGPATARKGQMITYYYTVTNSGPASVMPKVVDNKCSPVTYVGGDTNNDGRVGPGETWTFQCRYTVTGKPGTSITNKATVSDLQKPASGWYLGGDRNNYDNTDTWTLQIVK